MSDHWDVGNRVAVVATLVTVAVSTVGYVLLQLAAPHDPNMLTGYVRVLTAIVLGGAAAGGYGILWSLAERIFDWHFAGGGGPELPAGWKAVVLSLTTTLPLALLPWVFEFITPLKIVLPLHWRASAFMIITAAVGHLLLYGTQTPRILGLRDRVFPQGSPLDLWRAIRMEFIYTIVHFASTIYVYQIVVHFDELSVSTILWAGARTALSAFLFFLGACSYIIIRYPASLVPVPVLSADGSTWMDNRWVAARGVINGAILMVAFMIGILLESPSQESFFP